MDPPPSQGTYGLPQAFPSLGSWVKAKPLIPPDKPTISPHCTLAGLALPRRSFQMGAQPPPQPQGTLPEAWGLIRNLWGREG